MNDSLTFCLSGDWEWILVEDRMGWKTGFEPATSGTTIQRSNLLSYIHHDGMGLGVSVGVNVRTAYRGGANLKNILIL